MIHTMPLHDYEKYFPFEKIRKEQRDAIEFAINAYESGKKYVILEMGTGCGKSATGITIARYMEQHGKKVFGEDNMPLTGAYVLTTQKILQQQYLSDFGPGTGRSKNLLLSIKSANNYQCSFYSDQSCAESRRIISQLGKHANGTDFHKHCRGGSCPYAVDKQSFVDSPISITNFSYFFAETIYGGKLTPRSFLIIDECHNIENELGKFIEVTFSEKFAKEVLRCKIPALTDQKTIFDWICHGYFSSLKKHTKKMEKTIKAKFSDNIDSFGDISKQYELLDKHTCKVERFISSYDPDNWVVNIIRPPVGSKRGMRKFEFKPIDVSKYSHENLYKFGGRTLMMSATVIDKHIFCSTV
jgi:ATP-dependent DNA helicase DinG